MPLLEAEAWIDHLGACSPCYNDFAQFREASQRDRSRTLLAVAASILLVATVAGWALLRNRSDNLPAQTALLDLRNRSVARGSETNPDEPPLELTRTAKNLKILLPLGSSEGPYEVRVSCRGRSEEHTSELQSPDHLVCRLLLEKKKIIES